MLRKKRNLVRKLVSGGANPANLSPDQKEIYEQQQYFRKINMKSYEKTKIARQEARKESYLKITEIHKKYDGSSDDIIAEITKDPENMGLWNAEEVLRAGKVLLHLTNVPPKNMIILEEGDKQGTIYSGTSR